MKKKIIATGLSGLVGSRIAQLLGKKYNFVNFGLETGIDITDFNLLKQKFAEHLDADLVFHLAAFTDVNAAWEQMEKTEDKKNTLCYKVNVIGSKNIARLSNQFNKYLIHISTDFVFNGDKSFSDCYQEEDKPDPIEWYGYTKYLAEKEVNKSGCKHVILRIAFPFKAKPAPEIIEPKIKLDLVRKMIQKLKNNDQLSLFVDQKITPTFIDDIVKALEECIEDKPQGIFHCVGSTSISPYDLAGKVADVFNLPKKNIIKTKLADFLKNHPHDRPRQVNLSLSNKKIEKQLGIEMMGLEDALKLMKKQLVS